MLEKESGWIPLLKTFPTSIYYKNEKSLIVSNKITEPDKKFITYQTSKEIVKKEILYNKNIEKEDIEEILSLLKE